MVLQGLRLLPGAKTFNGIAIALNMVSYWENRREMSPLDIFFSGFGIRRYF